MIATLLVSAPQPNSCRTPQGITTPLGMGSAGNGGIPLLPVQFSHELLRSRNWDRNWDRDWDSWHGHTRSGDSHWWHRHTCWRWCSHARDRVFIELSWSVFRLAVCSLKAGGWNCNPSRPGPKHHQTKKGSSILHASRANCTRWYRDPSGRHRHSGRRHCYWAAVYVA